jgi:hypothetical protein
MENWRPDFDVKLQGHAIATYRGPKSADMVAKLYEYFRKEKWRGQFVINFPGNGGVNDMVFTEVRRASEMENGNGVKKDV